MDTTERIMDRRSGFDVRKLTITVVTSVSLAVIIQAHWFSGGVVGQRLYKRLQTGTDAESVAVLSTAGNALSGGESEAVWSEKGSGAAVPERGSAAQPETGGSMADMAADGGPQVRGQSIDISESEVNEIYRENPEQLVLVNRENPLDPSYDAVLQKICGGRLEASSRLYEGLQAMLEEAADAGHTFWIASAYRSREKQQELIDEEVEMLVNEGLSRDSALDEVYRETMPAGCSEHETGLALDILVSGNEEMDRSQEETAGNQWLRENCQEYGFVLRYPEDKSAVTGVDYEPWHFRYVGKRAARFLKDHGLTLEEFYQIMEA